MPQTRIHDLLGRLPQNGPWLASLALAALIAVDAARVALSFWGAGPVKSIVPEMQSAPPVARNTGVDIASITNAHLFGSAVPDPQSEETAHESTANLQLAGTIATQDPKHGLAIIADGGPAKVYSVGNNIGGATLYSVYLDHVILDRGGALETLKLPRIVLGGGRLAPVRRQIGVDPTTASNLENVRRMVQDDPSVLNEVMRTVPSYDNKAGKLRGFRVYPGRNRAAFNGLGLRPGDLVTAINGTPLDDPQRGQEIFNTIQTAASANVTIERGGQTIEVSMNIAQIANEANRDLTQPATTPPPAFGSGPAAFGAAPVPRQTPPILPTPAPPTAEPAPDAAPEPAPEGPSAASSPAPGGDSAPNPPPSPVPPNPN
jgi:general secretion pathway protein C